MGILDEEGTAGRRSDNRNLIQEWQIDKANRNVSFKYIWNKEQLNSANSDLPEYLLGLFEGSHLQYNLEANKTTEPTLTELTETAIKMLSRNEKGFFLFVEGGRIDHAHHDNMVELALDETLEFHSAVAKATEMLSEEDSLIVVTADHAHVMAYNGYSTRGRDILGPSNNVDKDGRPFMTLSYINGPGFRSHENGARADVTEEPTFSMYTLNKYFKKNLKRKKMKNGISFKFPRFFSSKVGMFHHIESLFKQRIKKKHENEYINIRSK